MRRGLRRRPPPPGRGRCSPALPSKATFASPERHRQPLRQLLLLWRAVVVVVVAVVAPHAAAGWTAPYSTSATRVAAAAASQHRRLGSNPPPFGFGGSSWRASGSAPREESSAYALGEGRRLSCQCLPHRRRRRVRPGGSCDDTVLHASAPGPGIEGSSCGNSIIEEDHESSSTDPRDNFDPARHKFLGRRLTSQQPPLGPPPPYLAVVTEPDSCRTEERLQQALHALAKALLPGSSGEDGSGRGARLGGGVNLVVVRLGDDSSDPVVPRNSSSSRQAPAILRTSEKDVVDDGRRENDEAQMHRRRVGRFVRTLVEWSAGDDDAGVGGDFGVEGRRVVEPQRWRSRRRPKFLVLLSSGLLLGDDPPRCDLVWGVHGVHIKESHRSRLPELGEGFDNRSAPVVEVVADEGGLIPAANFVVGMSCHSIDSAVEAMRLYRPDYLLVGTCYPTLSHPEKSPIEVEGPDLPGQVRWELERRVLERAKDGDERAQRRRPIVLGIGGIDSTNCGRVLRAGADGVAVIRSVLADPDPAAAVLRIHDAMRRSSCSGSEPPEGNAP